MHTSAVRSGWRPWGLKGLGRLGDYFAFSGAASLKPQALNPKALKAFSKDRRAKKDAMTSSRGLPHGLELGLLKCGAMCLAELLT